MPALEVLTPSVRFLLVDAEEPIAMSWERSGEITHSGFRSSFNYLSRMTASYDMTSLAERDSEEKRR